MISAIGFVPQGKADPRPKRYELSTGEMNMLKAVEVSLKPVRPSNHYLQSLSQIPSQSILTLHAQTQTNESSNPDALPPSPFADTPASNALPTVDISSLPADLRMDEYDEEVREAEEICASPTHHPPPNSNSSPPFRSSASPLCSP